MSAFRLLRACLVAVALVMPIALLAARATLIVKDARKSAEKAQDAGDAGTNDLLVSNILRTNDLQAGFLAEQLVAATPA